MTIRYRTPEPDELDAVIAAGELPFGDTVDPAEAEHFKEIIEPDRVHIADDDGTIAGVASSRSCELSVPGGRIPLGAVSLLSVLPTHRRRGIGGNLLERVHAEARERGEPAVGLMASESRIYGRFGYGVATRWAVREAPTAHARLRAPADLTGRVRFVDGAEASRLLLGCLDALAERVAGMPHGVEAAVRGRLTRDPASWRDGAGARMLVAYEDRGVVAYRVKQRWSPTGPEHTLLVTDLVAQDDAALAALWTYCLTVDLVTRVEAQGRPVDEPIGHLLVDPRRMRATVTDGVWLRPLDVGGLLTARRYDADGTWTLAVQDPLGLADGTYRLAVRAGVAEVEAIDAPPDASLPVDSLGAAYLGDTRLTALARAGRATEHTAGALRALDRALATDPLPWCPITL